MDFLQNQFDFHFFDNFSKILLLSFRSSSYICFYFFTRRKVLTGFYKTFAGTFRGSKAAKFPRYILTTKTFPLPPCSIPAPINEPSLRKTIEHSRQVKKKLSSALSKADIHYLINTFVYESRNTATARYTIFYSIPRDCALPKFFYACFFDIHKTGGVSRKLSPPVL